MERSQGPRIYTSSLIDGEKHSNLWLNLLNVYKKLYSAITKKMQTTV